MSTVSTASAPVHVVCAVIRRGDGVLLAQRPDGKRLAGLWEFPGGKVEAGEEPAAALHREIMEELGCAITALHSGPPVFHAYSWGEICLHPFLCELASEQSDPQAYEHASLAWVLPAALRDYDLAPADIPVVDWLQTVLPQI